VNVTEHGFDARLQLGRVEGSAETGICLLRWTTVKVGSCAWSLFSNPIS